MREISAEQFDSEIESGKVIVDWFGSWCKPCSALMPVLEAFAEEHPEIKVVKIDVDDAHELAAEYAVRSIPKLIFFRDGNEIRDLVGVATKEQLSKLIG